jgi:hypothetical protein
MGGLFNDIGMGRKEVDPSDEIKRGMLYGEDDDTELMGDWATGEKGSLSGYTAEIDPSTGEVKYFKDIEFDAKKALEGASKIGDFSPKVIGKTSKQPDVNMPSVSGGRYSPQQSPYAAPSYLQGSTEYNKQVGKLVEALLRNQIRGRSIKSLI